jgi:RNA polymerase sigma factor (sigma-70 family)
MTVTDDGDPRPRLMVDPDWLAERFETHRTHLRAVAYRMLGSMSEADDAVQDAWLRLARSDAASVENLGGWLTTVVARLCLDRLRARTARREEPMGVHVPEPIVSSPDAPDPEEQAILADSVGLAMLVVLETLSPAERLAFVLHDTFGLPFEQIAPIVDRTPTATRQLASRARRRVRGSVAPAHVSPARQRELVDAFLAAARSGNFEALLRVLDPEVVVRADVGAGASQVGRTREVRGAAAVARQAMAFRALAPGARAATVNGAAGIVVFAEGRPFAVLGFAFRGSKAKASIAEIDILLDPERLARLDLGGVSAT